MSLAFSANDTSVRASLTTTIVFPQIAARQAVDDLISIEQEMPLLQLREREQLRHASTADGDRGATPMTASSDSRVRGGGGSAHRRDGAVASGPPPDDPSIDPHRKGIVSRRQRSSLDRSVPAHRLCHSCLLFSCPSRAQDIIRIDPTFNVERETVRAEVFTSSIRPPTMSMEEWGDIVTGKRLEREQREKRQSEGRVRSLNELHETGASAKHNGAASAAAVPRMRTRVNFSNVAPLTSHLPLLSMYTCRRRG